MALATQARRVTVDAGGSLFRLSRVYTVQQEYAGLQRAIVQSTIYGRSWTQDFEGVFRSILNYMGDVSYFDPDAAQGVTTRCIPEIDSSTWRITSGGLR